ncbi:zona pellucida sperm-binding protein 2-like [Lethenteron reissneri]|uniref:zona pellucida sperm-binding protein 2-like n=1 Tax=Lethenteron reissneri TaxID=7753 RepID=UPI002AB64575|nr:zona pellucida sperm-binding protein 2-like [Lethenteron reissneri]
MLREFQKQIRLPVLLQLLKHGGKKLEGTEKVRLSRSSAVPPEPVAATTAERRGGGGCFCGTLSTSGIAMKSALLALCSLLLWTDGSSAAGPVKGRYEHSKHTRARSGLLRWDRSGDATDPDALLYSYGVGLTTVNCSSSSMRVAVSRILPDFSALGVLHAKEPMSWYLDIDNGTAQWSIPVADASQAGYTFESQQLTLSVMALYTASGVFYSQFDNTSLYFLDLRMRYGPTTTVIYFLTPMLCLVPNYLQCNDTSLVVTVPPLPGPLTAVKVGTTLVYPDLPSVPGVEVRLEGSGGRWGFVLSLQRTSPLLNVEACPMGQSSGVRHFANMSMTFTHASRPLTFPLLLRCPCVAVQDDISAVCNGSFLLAVFGPLYGSPPAIEVLTVGTVSLLTSTTVDSTLYDSGVKLMPNGSYYVAVSAYRTAPGVVVQSQEPGRRLYSALFHIVVVDGLGLRHDYSVEAACHMPYTPSGVVSCGPSWFAITLQLAEVRDFTLLVSEVPVTQLLDQGYSLTNSTSELRLQVDFTALDVVVKTLPDGSTEWSLLLTLRNDLGAVEEYSLVCTSNTAECSTDGQMTFEVYASSTRPPLDLATVHVRDPSCLPVEVTAEKAVFVVPLDECGTTHEMVDGKLVYENEAVSLMRDSIHVIISRSSEYRMKITCEFSGDDLLMLGVTVPTLSPPSPANGTGPLVIELTMFPDVDYVAPYVAADYPLVRFLREPLFVQVQLLAHPDPVLELRLADCWATTQPDPNSLPQWDLLVSGCPFSGDNYLTTVHAVSPASVPLPLRFKRFEVKTFVFADPAPLGALRDTLYFHCSATVCDSNSADLPQCGPSSCSPSTRRAREDVKRAATDDLTHIASLPGPITLSDDVHTKSDLSSSAEGGVWPTWFVWLVAATCSLLALSIAVALVAKLLRHGRQGTWRRAEAIRG